MHSFISDFILMGWSLMVLPCLLLLLWLKGIRPEAAFTPTTRALKVLQWVGILAVVLAAALHVLGMQLVSFGLWSIPLITSISANAAHALARQTSGSHGTKAEAGR